jgi:hypothetical protein
MGHLDEPAAAASALAYVLSEQVAADVIDGEAVLVSFDQGRYFACRGLGATVISALLAGPVAPAMLAEELARAHQADLAIAQRDLETFLRRLCEEGLVRATQQPPVAWRAPAANGPYAPAELEAHDELSDILALDPIHDVAPARGWPAREK